MMVMEMEMKDGGDEPLISRGDGRAQLLDRETDGYPPVRALRRNGVSRKNPRCSAHAEPSATRHRLCCSRQAKLGGCTNTHPHAEPSLRSRLPVVVAAGLPALPPGHHRASKSERREKPRASPAFLLSVPSDRLSRPT